MNLPLLKPPTLGTRLPPFRMKADTSSNSSFSKLTNGFQLAYDSVSLGQLKTCPRLYYYTIVRGWRTGRENDHLTFGLLFHALLEFYDYQIAQGQTHEDAVIETTAKCLELTFDKPSKRPWISSEPTKTRYTLLRSVLWYLDHFSSDPLETFIRDNGKPAVEYSFSFPTGLTSENDNEPILYCGHMDRVVIWSDALWVLDRKTTKGALDSYYFARFNPDNQMSGYFFSGNIVFNPPIQGIIIDAAQIGVTFTRFQRGFVNRSEEHLAEWFHGLSYYVGLAERFANENYWPQNDKACSIPRVNPITLEVDYGCPFREICSTTPALRDIQSSGHFKTKLWDPLVSREI